MTQSKESPSTFTSNLVSQLFNTIRYVMLSTAHRKKDFQFENVFFEIR